MIHYWEWWRKCLGNHQYWGTLSLSPGYEKADNSRMNSGEVSSKCSSAKMPHLALSLPELFCEEMNNMFKTPLPYCTIIKILEIWWRNDCFQSITAIPAWDCHPSSIHGLFKHKQLQNPCHCTYPTEYLPIKWIVLVLESQILIIWKK